VSIRSRFGVAAAAILLMGAGNAAFAQSGCTGGGKISKQIAKPMDAAQKAIAAKKWQEVLQRVREAEATTGYIRSESDKFWMSEFRGYAYLSLRQDAEAAREFEAGLNSPCMQEAKKPERLKNLVGIYTSLRNYNKAIEYGNRALKMSRDPEIMVAVAQAYYQSGDNKNSVKVMNDLMDSLEKSGRAPKEQQLLLVLAACQRAGDKACVSRVFEKLVVYYPKPEYWQNAMVAIREADTNDLQALNVMRLATHVNVMKKPDEYKEMAQLALEQKLAGEAQSVLEQGFAKKVFVDDRQVSVNTRLLEAAKKEAAVDKAALAKNEAAAAAAATGDAYVQVGAQYLGFGDAAKAAQLIQKGIAKGGIGKADPATEAQKNDEANILLGIAHLRNNNKAEAAKAFRAVKRDPTMARIAKLWLLNT
jgi:tetratricopeptide (TPR) repeat protein